jgi:prevent-host-death family protein
MIIEVRDLEERTREILRQVEAGETIEVMDHGKAVARLIPYPIAIIPDEARYDEMTLDELIAELDRSWPEGVSAVDAIRDVRREL